MLGYYHAIDATTEPSHGCRAGQLTTHFHNLDQRRRNRLISPSQFFLGRSLDGRVCVGRFLRVLSNSPDTASLSPIPALCSFSLIRRFRSPPNLINLARRFTRPCLRNRLQRP